MSFQTKDTSKICGFYIGNYHLATMLIPYISKKIEKGEKVIAVLDKGIENEVKTLVGKINISEKLKKEILSINWKETKDLNMLDIKENEKIDIIVTGNENKIEYVNNKLEKIQNKTLINLYNLEENNNMVEIVAQYSYIINTSGIHEKEAV